MEGRGSGTSGWEFNSRGWDWMRDEYGVWAPEQILGWGDGRIGGVGGWGDGTGGGGGCRIGFKFYFRMGWDGGMHELR